MIPGITASAISAAAAGDPDFASVALLLKFNGANGGTSFPDSGPIGRSVTPSGNAQTSTAQFKWNGSSALFDGSGDYLTVAAQNDWKFLHDGTTNWTVEVWARFSDFSTSPAILANATGSAQHGVGIFINSSRQPRLLIVRGVAGAVIDLAAPSAIPNDGDWHFLQWTYEPSAGSNNAKIYIDGVLAGQQTKSFTPSSSNPTNVMLIGAFGGTPSAGNLNGYLQDLRVTKVLRGSTPPTEAFPDS